MSPQVINALQAGSTSAGGAMHSPPDPYPLVVPGSLPTFGTAARSLSFEDWEGLLLVPVPTGSSEWTSGGQNQERLDTRAAISEFRRLAGLTWEQLARVFGVARRSLHFWASGKPINATNEEHLRRLLAVLRQADRGTAQGNREMLLHDHHGVIPLDLLTAGRYDEFIQWVGEGPGRRTIKLKPLSREAREARKPLPPEQLVDALQDRVHIEPGRLLSAKPIRRKREK